MSIYSGIPNEKFPLLSNFLSAILFSTAFNNLANNKSAFFPLIVTFAAICKFGLNPHVGILFSVFVLTGFDCDITCNSLIAFSNLSPGTPTPMLSVTLSILICFIKLIFFHLNLFLVCLFLQQMNNSLM